MLTLINTNLMAPPIAPVGLEYLACAARQAGIEVHILDLCLADDPDQVLRNHFKTYTPQLVGLSLRNVDDCFWPSCQWFVPDIAQLVKQLRTLTHAPIVIGGIGYSVFPKQIVEFTNADFGIHGDGEQAVITLYREISHGKHWDQVPGLVWRQGETMITNAPAWPQPLTVPPRRDMIDNHTYFIKGGQLGFETKRGCNRPCIYCADPLAKGTTVRLRDPEEVADEVETLQDQGIDVLHTCDAEFNIPDEHARDVCEAFIRRGLGNKIRWYAYLSVVPFDQDLARTMQRAGCVGIDFTTDAACAPMLKTYGQPYRPEDITRAVTLCRDHGMAVMTDMLIGGPGETPDTLAKTIRFMKQLRPDGIGTGLGIRIYPGTGMEALVREQGPLEHNPNIHRKYDGPIDLFQPTFYISEHLGPNPARLVKDLINSDPRFFEPMEEIPTGQTGHADSKDHNYNDNTELVEAITKGARGAYWDIMRKLKIEN
jgi:radical SAM superfamily enzyme YgiQ (UPF0313 family)